MVSLIPLKAYPYCSALPRVRRCNWCSSSRIMLWYCCKTVRLPQASIL